MTDIKAWLDREGCPAQPPRLPRMAERTRMLHQGIDDHIRREGVGYLHPDSATLMLDVLGSRQVVKWQEAKAALLFMGEGCWSELPHLYARYGTGAGQQLITQMRALEQASCVVLADSGMQATALVFDALMRPGSHAVVMRQIYNKSRSYLMMLAERLGGSVTVVDDGDEEALTNAIGPDTVLVFCETFTNPLMRAQDPQRLGQICKRAKQAGAHSLSLVIDSTIATPWAFQHPLLTVEGVDVVVASGTKALAGQDRDMWGYVATNDVDLGNQVMDLVALRGGNLDWRRAEVIVQGLERAKELHERRCDNASKVAAFLDAHSLVEKVHHPSLASHTDAQAIATYYQRHGSMVSFQLRSSDEQDARHFCDVLVSSEVVRYALSFDGLATKVNHHKSVSEYFTPPDQLERAGLSCIVRLAVGTEEADDILAILNWALHHHQSVTSEQLLEWQDERAESLGIELGS